MSTIVQASGKCKTGPSQRCLIVPLTDPEPSQLVPQGRTLKTQPFRLCQKSLGVRRHILSGRHWSVVNFALMNRHVWHFSNPALESGRQFV